MSEPAEGVIPVGEVVAGSCVEVMRRWPDRSVDLVFADPPYNLQLRGELQRPDRSLVLGVDDDWDRFSSFEAYDDFTRAWLTECRRLLKDDGAIWVIGSYHNIFRVGAIMMDLGFWILNDVIWHKSNPMPNFRGTRFQNATETLIWAKKSVDQQRSTFNYEALKNANDDLQMQNVWHIPLCIGNERLRTADGRKAHATQKPEALLHRVLFATTRPDDLVLDPFMGSGTTGAVARRLGRRFVGIDQSAEYVALARQRIAAVPPADPADPALAMPSRRRAPRVAFARLIEAGHIAIGQRVLSHDRRISATVRADGHLQHEAADGSIHRVAALAQQKLAANGWDFWHIEDPSGALISIDDLRARYRTEAGIAAE